MKKKALINSLFLIMLAIFTLTFVGCDDTGEKAEITTVETDALKLTKDYDGKSFLNDGIGKVSLTQNVDGDTAHFKDLSTGYNFTARFLMINTPESTGKIDPWGKAASKFVAGKLADAAEIVLESEIVGSPAVKDTTNKRYLAYIWYKPSNQDDFRLINLELVEECYSRFVNDTSAGKYGDVFQKVDNSCSKMELRVYGEKDPNYDYSYTVTELTLSYLRENFEKFADNGSKIKLTVRVVRKNGNNIYIEDIEKTDSDITGEYDTVGIYMFSGYSSPFGRAKIGAVYSFQCQCTNNETYGCQLTNPLNVKLVEKPSEISLREFDGKSKIDLESLEGYVIKVDKVRIEEIGKVNEEGAYTVRVSTDSEQTFNVRIDAATTPKFNYYDLEVGQERVLIGGVSKYSDSLQVMLCNYIDEGGHDFDLFTPVQ